jgi:hypothetical protein
MKIEILMRNFRRVKMNKIEKKKRIIIENIKDLEYKERIDILESLLDMYKSEMLIFGESK